jgi:hypothetical protein
MKDAQVAKQVEQRKQTHQNHYGPPQQQDIQYNRNDNNKRSSATYGRDSYQDKRSRNDRGRSPSRDRSNSHTRSPRSPGDNHRNGATETAHHSTMTKRNISILTPDFTQHHQNLATPRDITRTKRHGRKEQKTHKKIK